MNFIYRRFFFLLAGGGEVPQVMDCRVYFCGRDHASTPVDQVLHDFENLDWLHPEQMFWMKISRRIDATGTVCFEADDTVFKADPPLTKRPCFAIIVFGDVPVARFSLAAPLQKEWSRLELGWQGVVAGKQGRIIEVSSYEEEEVDV